MKRPRQETNFHNDDDYFDGYDYRHNYGPSPPPRSRYSHGYGHGYGPPSTHEYGFPPSPSYNYSRNQGYGNSYVPAHGYPNPYPYGYGYGNGNGNAYAYVNGYGYGYGYMPGGGYGNYPPGQSSHPPHWNPHRQFSSQAFATKPPFATTHPLQLLKRHRLTLYFRTFFFTYASSSLKQEYKSAGILPYTFVNNEPYVLLGCEDRSSKVKRYGQTNQGLTWLYFGGKRESGETMEDTAWREFNEETAQIFASQKDTFFDEFRYSHKLWCGPGKFVLFFVPIKYDPTLPETFQKAEKTDIDQVAIQWVSVKELILGCQGKDMVLIDDTTGSLFTYFAKMLNAEPRMKQFLLDGFKIDEQEHKKLKVVDPM